MDTLPSDQIEIGGWDIGGAHVKGARVRRRAGRPEEARVAVRAFEIWRGPEALPSLLEQVADDLGLPRTAHMAVTMTAELADAFRTKREGVCFVLESVRAAFPHGRVHVLSADGDLVAANEALQRPLEFAATNWIASGLLAAERARDCLLVDVGSTTSDIIPIRNAAIDCEGRTDTTRLVSGELVYSGVVRTNPNTLVSTIPVHGRACGVAAESFCLMADAYVLLERLSPEAYTCPTADGRAKSPEACAERLARLVCADVDLLTEEEIVTLARYLFEMQMQQVSRAVLQVLSRLPDVYRSPLVPVGVGAFLAAEVGRRLGFEVLSPDGLWGSGGAVALPAMAAACILARRLEEGLP